MSLSPFSVALSRTTWNPALANECVTDRAPPNGTPSISQRNVLPEVESDVNVAGWPVTRVIDSAGVRWKAATGAASAAGAQTQPSAARTSAADSTRFTRR